MKHRLLAILACAIFLSAGMTTTLAAEPAPPAVTIRLFEEGRWYPLLAPDDTLLTAEALPDFVTGLDGEDRRWEVPVLWDLDQHRAEVSSFQDFTLRGKAADTLVGPGNLIYQVRADGPAAELSLPVCYIRRGPIGTDPKLSGLEGSYAPWRGKLTLTYNKIGIWEAAPPDADRVLIQVSTDQARWETVRDVTGERGGRFDVDVPALRTEDLYYRVWVEGGPQAGASTEYRVVKANAALPKVHTVTLENLTVEAGEQVVYQTVAENLLDAPENGLYPGELTIRINGRVVVKSGGRLVIGTYASGGPEKRPVLQGAPSQDGLIQVEPGGVLELDGVAWELEGREGCAIRQEDGAAVRLDHTDLDPGFVQWGAPLIDNSSLSFQDVWLEAGTPLTESPLPREAETWVLDRGASVRSVLPIRWELGEDAGRREGEAVLSGTFLDGAGAPMSTLVPLTVTVRWYAAEEIPVTGTAWLGDTAPAARLHFSALPDRAAEIWGEWSEDGGKTWTRWERCEFKENDKGPYCVFHTPDSAPRLYRVAAESADGTLRWASKGVLLPDADTDPEDPDGNRGGSTGVVQPNREPEPDTPPAPDPTPPILSGPETAPAELPALPDPEDAAPEASFKTTLPAPAGSPEVPAMIPSVLSRQDQKRPDETDRQVPAVEPGLLPEAGTTPEPHPSASGTRYAEGEEQSPPKSVQAVLAAAGLGGCVLAGLGLTGSGPFKRKK